MKGTKNNMQCGGVSSAVYGLGFVGALVYYLQHATSFTNGLIGLLKAVLWPGFLIYKVIDLLKI